MSYTQSEVREAKKILKKEQMYRKPEGIGGSCQCETCNYHRPIYNAITLAFSILTDYAEGRLVRPMGREEIKKIIYAHFTEGYYASEDASLEFPDTMVFKRGSYENLLNKTADAILTAMKGE